MSKITAKPGQWRANLEDGEYFQSWYPLALARDLKPDTVLGRDFMDTRVVLYRDPAGKAVVQSAYCPHLGADLSVGEMIDGEIRCPYHHWKFNAAGMCTRIPTGDKIPPKARLFNYPTEEAWGLVWAFNGETPLFPVPTIPDTTEEDCVFVANERGERPIDHWLSTSNAFDFQHLRAVHHMPDAVEPETIDATPHSLEYRRGNNRMLHHGRVTGTNTFAHHLVTPEGEHFMLVSSAPMGPGKSLSFYVMGIPKSAELNDPRQEAVAERFKVLIAGAHKLYSEDEPVLYTQRFRPPGEGQWIGADKHLAGFFRYLKEFPRARPFDT
jgi:phenylpropionate dioxygenase-like ring-hydroxylating dioxygenase large terminal subunit